MLFKQAIYQLKLFCSYAPRIALLLLALCSASLCLAVPAKTNSIMILGDSISAAYGIERNEGWVSLLEQYLQENITDKSYHIINASISGETTGGGLTRLPNLLEQHQPNIVIIELGGNDGLRGFTISNLRSNLDTMAELSLAANAKVLIAGMRIPPNYGTRYTNLFYDSFRLTAEKHQLPLIPFLLEGIATNPELMQRDGIHPTAEGQPLILKNVLEQLNQLLE
jgi:acyl-CoA thioesterase-1